MSNWKEQLLQAEWQDSYDTMTDEQKKMVNLLVVRALRYPADDQISELEALVKKLRVTFPWHRGDEGSPDVPVLQPRYDALRARVAELEQTVAWQTRRLEVDSHYLPFVREYYWYEPTRGPVIYAYEANRLEQRLQDTEDELRRLKAIHPSHFDGRI